MQPMPGRQAGRQAEGWRLHRTCACRCASEDSRWMLRGCCSSPCWYSCSAAATLPVRASSWPRPWMLCPCPGSTAMASRNRLRACPRLRRCASILQREAGGWVNAWVSVQYQMPAWRHSKRGRQHHSCQTPPQPLRRLPAFGTHSLGMSRQQGGVWLAVLCAPLEQPLG
jgi:hypothetical protein